MLPENLSLTCTTNLKTTIIVITFWNVRNLFHLKCINEFNAGLNEVPTE